jgi:GNAT superfamily N-acetyltransferase
MEAPFRLEPLNAGHDRSAFHCGQEVLDHYLRRQATQDIRRRIAACFVAVERATNIIAAYYTLASAGIPLTDLPSEIGRKLPRYPSIPAVRIGRLAVDLRYQGRGLGAALLADALDRTLNAAPAAYALLVDAKDDAPADFYRHFGFIQFASQPLVLFLPIDTARKIFR